MCPRTREFRPVPAEPPVEMAGAGGLVMLAYSGVSTVQENGIYPGTASGSRYRFGMDKPRGFVDKRDAPGLLACFEDGKPVFEVVQ